ncbi:hypothetical protein IQ256_14765 [cf. Phormidesmis sp. LEGE 11477]|nr:hypothetical protein [cf. Phormidesmis sp. LEGE 11477]
MLAAAVTGQQESVIEIIEKSNRPLSLSLLNQCDRRCFSPSTERSPPPIAPVLVAVLELPAARAAMTAIGSRWSCAAIVLVGEAMSLRFF